MAGQVPRKRDVERNEDPGAQAPDRIRLIGCGTSSYAGRAATSGTPRSIFRHGTSVMRRKRPKKPSGKRAEPCTRQDRPMGRGYPAAWILAEGAMAQKFNFEA